MKRSRIILLCTVFLLSALPFVSCTWETKVDEIIVVNKDLNAIRSIGKLRVAVLKNCYSYFVYRGQPMGYEYDLINDFAKKANLELEFLLAESPSELYALLQKGEADVIAGQLPIASLEKNKITVTDPYLFGTQVLVQRKPENWRHLSSRSYKKALVNTYAELNNRELSVVDESASSLRLDNFIAETNSKIKIRIHPDSILSEHLIEGVSLGDLDCALVDEHTARLLSMKYSNVDYSMPLSVEQPFSFACRENASELIVELNKWVAHNKKFRAVIYGKYFRDRKKFWSRSDNKLFASNSGVISHYDELIKFNAERLNWDWRLLAALICQESNFVHNAESRKGAQGLMQIVPSTAARFGMDTSESANAAQNLYAGVNFLRYLDRYWSKRIEEKEERINFILASYNVGLGHVLDAQALAEKFNENPLKWDDSVEQFLLKKSESKYYRDPVVKSGYCRGKETVAYVQKVRNYYQHYCNVIKIEEAALVAAN